MSLIDVARRGNLEEVQRLINSGVDIHVQNDQALFDAASNGHLPVVEFLVDHGADIHAQHDLALIHAAGEGNLPVVEYLLSQGANINVLSSEQREQYQHLVPQIISVPEYYQLELSIERIREIAERYIISTKKETYTLLK